MTERERPIVLPTGKVFEILNGERALRIPVRGETKCPYIPGDVLWVKETWAALRFSVDWETGYVDDIYEAPHIPKNTEDYWSAVYITTGYWEDNIEDRGFKWRPPVSMPRWAARLFLKVTSVWRADPETWVVEFELRTKGQDMLGKDTLLELRPRLQAEIQLREGTGMNPGKLF